MTPLAERLAQRIAAGGPITVAHYMTAVLGDPQHGYYRGSDPLGSMGDFTTAPEISQIFGELIGAWLVDMWRQMGAPNPVRLVELGPGRGTLMADALRAGRTNTDWIQAIDVHLVEINPELRRLQAERLARYRPSWHESLDAVPDGPLLLVANEFFDALPIHQLVLSGGVWRERLIGWSDDTGFRFSESAAPSPLAALVPASVRNATVGGVFELALPGIGVADLIGGRIAKQGGAALVIDYGRAETGCGESLQAVRRHQMVGVLDEPGAADLSAHVDFAMLAKAANDAGATVHGPVEQGAFLERLGARHRARALQSRATPAQAAEIDGALDRLIGGDAMGALFKALAIASPGLTPAGFSASP